MYRTRIGPLEFAFCHAAVATAPPVEGPVIGFVDEVPVRSVTLGRERYLVVDHRPDPAAAPVAYIEWWRPAGVAEAPPAWLLALTAASGPPPDPSTGCDRCAGERAANQASAAPRPPRPRAEPVAVHGMTHLPRMVA